MKNAPQLEKPFDHFKKGKNDKVVLLGTAPSCQFAPFDDATFDIWGVAHCLFLQTCKRIDTIFELHGEEIWKKDNAPFHRFPNALVYLHKENEAIPNSKEFPLEKIREKYKVNKGFDYEADYFSSSLPFMICLAIEQGYKEIHVYGIHLLMDEEYFYQRPCFEYYLGIAVGKGIKVFVHPAADILKFPYIYGYQDMTQDMRKIRDRIQEFEQRQATLMQRRDQMLNELNMQIHQLIGAKEDAYYFLRNFGVETRPNKTIF